jgi:integrase
MRDEALFSTYAFTGLRRAEALRLDVSDYDAGKGVLPALPDRGTVAEPAQQQAEPLSHRNGPREAHARFQRWKKAAGLRPELTIHSFRAGFATALHRGCGDVILVSRALGHSDLRPTLRYVEPHTGRLSRAIERSFAGVA